MAKWKSVLSAPHRVRPVLVGSNNLNFNLPSILGVFKQLGQVPVSLSILVRPESSLSLSNRTNHSYRRFIQLLAIYTFRGLWIRTPSESLLVTKLLVTGIWIFVIFMIVLGNTLNLNKDEQHRYMTPVPVSKVLVHSFCPYTDSNSIAVLVLGGQRLPPMAHLGFVLLVLADLVGLDLGVHPPLLLASRENYSRSGIVVEIPNSTSKFGRGR